MASLLTIGEFSRLTHVSVKALRHYHDVGLLPPADVDPDTGYRYYAAAQAPTAQLIRRFRDTAMPLEQIKAVLVAADPAERDRVIIEHLRSMERQLEQTQATVASLRALLEGTAAAPEVELRVLEGTAALVATSEVAWDDTETWLHETLSDLRRRLAGSDCQRTGPDSALYSTGYFESHLGQVTAFIPVDRGAGLPGGPFAVTVHRGSFEQLDRVYATLGTFVAERGIGAAEPIREHYLVGRLDTPDEDAFVTEVCWPLTRQPAA